MRQNNKNNRGRGRGGRKGPNPLTRSYESNGPDVKVRGTAQHVAEKYMTLARDALSSGDSVAAENYFQHAEHYNRIIMTAQAQQNTAREEERRPQPSQQTPADQPWHEAEQPPFDAPPLMTGLMESDGEEKPNLDAAPPIVNGSEEQPRLEEPPKPRRRRAPAKPRQRKTEEQPSEPRKAEASDSISDNPPAFLLND